MSEEFNKKELLNWIETQPELDYIRKQANATKVDYRLDETEINRRIRPNPRTELPETKNLIVKIKDAFWVPGSNLRGTSYASKEHDKYLDQTAKVMSLSTIWDFVCTYPIFLYALKGFKGLALAPLPVATVLSLFILWVSNVVGENSTNRSKGRTGRANLSLIVFLILSAAKTAVSGVGLDMMLSENRIMQEKAGDILRDKGFQTNLVKNQVFEDDSFSEQLKGATEQCDTLTLQQEKLNLEKGSNRRIFNNLDSQKYLKPSNFKALSSEELLSDYSNQIGPCYKKELIESIQAQERRSINQNLVGMNISKATTDNLAALYLTSKGDYYNSFYGYPLDGFNVQEFKAKFDENFNLNIVEGCDNEKCEGPVRWVNGSDAIAASFTQFFRKLGDPSQIYSLSLSLFGFIVSIVLSGAAVSFLYLASKNRETRASYSNQLASKSNQIITEISED
tara:strand:+ start:10 stop:1362 length:1353 start_codon:yes stop_codon:yes gene_type:complete